MSEIEVRPSLGPLRYSGSFSFPFNANFTPCMGLRICIESYTRMYHNFRESKTVLSMTLAGMHEPDADVRVDQGDSSEMSVNASRKLESNKSIGSAALKWERRKKIK